MRRLTAYVAASAILAAAVILWAFYERPNFYSATVYLSQSNACLMILSNTALISVGGVMYGLEQLLFGSLRPVEIEQLYERGWFAITEWLFAMSTFRDEFGVWFLAMFTALFVGKVWGWIAEGRIETLEQQPPASPGLFHTRLVASLALYALFAIHMFWYCADTLVYEARPGAMVMFVFEFAIILISALSTILRYMLWWEEHRIVKKQIKQRVEERRAQLQAGGDQRETGQTAQSAEAGLPNVPSVAAIEQLEAIDEEEIEVAGWESKGGWLFALDIGTDFLKLIAYMAFFTILTVFYGIPIYIIRDMYLTLRSFSKRVNDYVKYQKATRDMNRRYPDATPEELAADNTCIVCREDMRPWRQPGAAPAAAQMSPERSRPKKLPCGHVLHFGCLRSWLERQQVCPICRRSVLAQPQTTAAAGTQDATNQNNGRAADEAVVQNNARAANERGDNAHINPVQRIGPRRFQFGPIRLEIGRPDQEALGNIIQRLQEASYASLRQPPATEQPQPNNANHLPNSYADDLGIQQLREVLNPAIANAQLAQFEQYLQRQFQSLSNTRYRMDITRALFRELERARSSPDETPSATPQWSYSPAFTNGSHIGNTGLGSIHRPFAQAHTVQSQPSSALPQGMVLPPGYQAMPLTIATTPLPTSRGSTSIRDLHSVDSRRLFNPSAPSALSLAATHPQDSRGAAENGTVATMANITSRSERALSELPLANGRRVQDSVVPIPDDMSASNASVHVRPVQKSPKGQSIPGISPTDTSTDFVCSSTEPLQRRVEKTQHNTKRAMGSSAQPPFPVQQGWDFSSLPDPRDAKESSPSVGTTSDVDATAATRHRSESRHQPTVEDVVEN